jgi:lipopolysaccharide export system protein LptA
LEETAVKSRQFLALAGIMVLCLTGLPLAYGAPPQPPATGKEIPLRITATSLEADQNAKTIIFTGQVKALYGDYILYCDKLLVYLKNKSGPSKSAAQPAAGPEEQSPLGDLGAGKIDRIVARGQVRFVQGDRVATGKEAIYYKDKDEVVLLGNPQLWQAENTLKGSRIVFNLKTNKVLAESSPQRRVEALLYSKGTAQGKTGLPFAPKTPKGRQP